jgi:polysaccharide pyruvyl transferase WcaK-like protein
MELRDNINVEWDNILLVWFWGHKNMWDELILLGNIKLLSKENKNIFVVSQDNDWLKRFLAQFIDTSKITFLDEIPRWFRSLWKYIKNKKFKQLKYFWKIDTVILGGWEILTEESPHAYYYWFWSLRPSFLPKRKLYLMWWIQIPKKWWNKLLFRFILKLTNKIFCRDLEETENIKNYWFKNVEFFMDTSYFAIDSWNKYKKESKEKYIIVNINSKWKLFVDDLIKETQKYLQNWYNAYFIPVCTGKTDDDAIYFLKIKEIIKNEGFVTYDRTKDFESFLNFLWWAEKVISARLHLFLISEFIWLDTKVYPYQKKINKMKKVIELMKIS